MNNSQTTATDTNGQYGQTQNPQTPGGQNLSAAAGNLQTVSTPNLFTGSGDVSITKVGDGNFTTYTPDNTTKTTIAVSVPKATHRQYPIIGASALLITIVILVSWLVFRKQSAY